MRPHQVEVLALKPLEPGRNESTWSCTNCRLGPRESALYWLVFDAHHSTVPIAVPMCPGCALPFAAPA